MNNKIMYKAIKVMNSCKTLEQLNVARKFVDLAINKISLNKFDRLNLTVEFLDLQIKTLDIIKERYL